ncbi:hypothetical protein [Paenibacillus xylanilyticus]
MNTLKCTTSAYMYNGPSLITGSVVMTMRALHTCLLQPYTIGNATGMN